MQLLPQPNEPEKLAIPIWWPAEDQKFLDGTNAEPPIKTRKSLWQDGWKRGISILRESRYECERYTYDLYQWAATIFETRSFRASLTMHREMLLEQRVAGPEVLDQIVTDKFSFLLPLLDIGNHNGVNNVDWRPDPKTGLGLISRGVNRKGDQVFNFYGNKSNSELLVGYGFTLPEIPEIGFDNNVVNLRLKAAPKALILRRSQQCHLIPALPEEECMFAINKRRVIPTSPILHECFLGLPHNLIDMIICMVANEREEEIRVIECTALSRCVSFPYMPNHIVIGPVIYGTSWLTS